MKNLQLTTALVALCFIAEAQLQIPRLSPSGSVSTTVGLTDVKIDYSRPRIRGRKIFTTDATALVPYGKIWQTGANNGTKISFSDDVTVEGIAVSKGEYIIFAWPDISEWTIVLTKDLSGNWEAYDPGKDAAKFKIKPETVTEKVETLTYNIGDISDDSRTAKVQLIWEHTSIKFTIATDYDSKVMKSIEASTSINPNTYYQAAVYYLENGKDLKQAHTWITQAAEANPKAFWVYYQKAKIEKAMGDTKAAAVSANASLTEAKNANNRDYQTRNEEFLKTLK